MRFFLNLGLGACLVFFMLSSAPLSNAQESLTLEIHPYLPATELFTRFAPLANYLSLKIGQPVTVAIAKDYQEHIDRVGRDEVDIAYLGPASYVKMTGQYGHKPILARLEINGKPTFRGVIVTVKDSPIRTLADLKGKRFAFGDPNSTMSHFVPLFMMWEAGVGIEDLSVYAYLHSHHNVALGVLMGDFDAGALKEEVFYEYRKRGLKDLAWTPQFSEHVFVSSKSLPRKKVQVLREVLFHLRDDAEGRALMSTIKEDMTGMVPASDEDYDNLRLILQDLKKRGVDP